MHVRPHVRHLPSSTGDKLDAKTQSCAGPNADAMHRQHRKLPVEAAKNAGFKPENEFKNPEKSGQIPENPAKSG
ncbi:MAG: hypothetical protein ABSH38_07720 [Verrucomicrobiota bacterium]|jgi:hypothetical protein